MVQEEDAQPISEPLVAPIKSKEFDLLEKSTPETTFNYDFLTALMMNHNLIRNVALVGQLHSGKTTLVDVFVQ